MKIYLQIIVLLSLCWPAVFQADPLGEALISLERQQMRWLAQQQNQLGVEIDDFISDGCSGGLSDAWQFLAQALPAFSERAGSRPPWESCCVEHDKFYWRGDTQQGYEKRLQADKTLRSCVLQKGVEQKEMLATRLQKPVEEIEHLFGIAADMMYQAVRLGGKPCSFLPWRWGYGWPHCTLPLKNGGDVN